MPKKSLQMSIIILALAIILTGCTGTTTHYSNKDMPNTEFHKGTEGLYMRFLPDTPPDRTYENSALDIMVEYSNRGAYKIVDGKLYLSGFDTQYIRPYPTMVPNLEAVEKSIFNPEGKVTQTATFSDSSVRLPTGVDKVKQTIKATACYVYRTQASIDVCIDPHTTTNLREDICQVQPSMTVAGGQGAPIAITRIEEEIYKDKLQFRIYFDNVGGGTVMKPTAINDCHTSLNRQDANKLEVREVSFSGKTMKCEPMNPITIDDKGKGFVFCSYQGNLGNDAYKTLLKIELEYGYRSSIQKDVEILQEP